MRLVSVSRLFKSYRKTELRADEVVLAVVVPLTQRWEYIQCYKQARRREDDIALVGGAFRVKLSVDETRSAWVVSDVGLAFAGMAPITAQSATAAAALRGGVWNDATLQVAYDGLRTDMALPDNVPGGTRGPRAG